MSYTIESRINPLIAKRERELLSAGFTYAEISQQLGVRHKSVSERNRLVYKIDIQQAFASRIQQAGIPVRLNVSDAFGYWFSGFVDGEGHFGAYSRVRSNKYDERRLILRIQIREDDSETIYYIRDNLKCGIVRNHKPNGSINASISICIERVEDLGELIVPLFDKYSLHTKKAREYLVWRELVYSQYILTMGGYSQRASCTEQQNAAFDAGVKAIHAIRHAINE